MHHKNIKLMVRKQLKKQEAADHVPATTANSALITLTRAVGGRSLDDGIRVVGISPGDMENERGTMFLRRYAKKKWGDAERWREMLDDLHGGRTPITSQPAAHQRYKQNINIV